MTNPTNDNFDVTTTTTEDNMDDFINDLVALDNPDADDALFADDSNADHDSVVNSDDELDTTTNDEGEPDVEEVTEHDEDAAEEDDDDFLFGTDTYNVYSNTITGVKGPNILSFMLNLATELAKSEKVVFITGRSQAELVEVVKGLNITHKFDLVFGDGTYNMVDITAPMKVDITDAVIITDDMTVLHTGKYQNDYARKNKNTCGRVLEVLSKNPEMTIIGGLTPISKGKDQALIDMCNLVVNVDGTVYKNDFGDCTPGAELKAAGGPVVMSMADLLK